MELVASTTFCFCNRVCCFTFVCAILCVLPLVGIIRCAMVGKGNGWDGKEQQEAQPRPFFHDTASLNTKWNTSRFLSWVQFVGQWTLPAPCPYYTLVKNAQHRSPRASSSAWPSLSRRRGAACRPSSRWCSPTARSSSGPRAAPTSGSAWTRASRAAPRRPPLGPGGRPSGPPPSTARHRHQRHGGRAHAAIAPGHLQALQPHQADVRGGLLWGAPCQLAIRLNWQQGGRSARPAVITVSCLGGSGRPSEADARETLSGMNGSRAAHTGHPPTHPLPTPTTSRSSMYRPRPTRPPRLRPSSTGTRRCRPTNNSCSSPATALTRPTQACASSASTTPPGRSTTADAVRHWPSVSRHIKISDALLSA